MFLDENYPNRITTHYIEDDVVIKFNLDQLTEMDLNSFILNLQDIIHHTDEIGEFSYGIFSIIIYSKNNVANEQIVVSNPGIKTEHYYKIY
jgi:hypothetical protein